YRHATPNQLRHQSRDAIKSALQPVVLDRDVLTLDVAGFLKTRAERWHAQSTRIGRRGADEPNHRQLRRLRPRDHWPSRSAAQSRNDLPPSYHWITSSARSPAAFRGWRGRGPWRC